MSLTAEWRFTGKLHRSSVTEKVTAGDLKILSERHPEGYQAMIRMKKDGEAMVVIHCFDGELPEEIRVELPKGCGTQDCVRIFL